ncbi:MAG TPA: hypothetical protein PLQ83_04065 [Thermoflexales bacterium]|nr:hypothetical protein [Thermoflexales bacterium]
MFAFLHEIEIANENSSFRRIGNRASGRIRGRLRRARDHADIAAVHGVLDRVGQHQQQDQINRGELAHLAFASNPQQHEQKDADNDISEA